MSVHALAFAYFLYLAVVGLARGGVRARRVSVAALVGTTIVGTLLDRLAHLPAVALAREAWPLALLLIGYRVAGLFFTRPDTALEARLLAIDRRLGVAGVASGPLGALFEAAYVGVYLVIPIGALVVWQAGDAATLDGFWTVVLAAGFACYGALPWIETRPPRALELVRGGDAPRALRRLNLAILERGSIGVNTLPSGHTATAIAVALAVTSASAGAGAVFLVIAALIAIATVVGRYHYTVDTVLGALAGLAAWALLG